MDILSVIAEERTRTVWQAVDQETGEIITADTDDELKQRLKEEHIYRCTRVRKGATNA